MLCESGLAGEDFSSEVDSFVEFKASRCFGSLSWLGKLAMSFGWTVTCTSWVAASTL